MLTKDPKWINHLDVIPRKDNHFGARFFNGKFRFKIFPPHEDEGSGIPRFDGRSAGANDPQEPQEPQEPSRGMQTGENSLNGSERIQNDSDEVFLSIANHNSAKKPDGFVKTSMSWADVVDMITMDRAYSASAFKDNYRTSANYLGGNTIAFLDIDDGLTFEQAKTMFAALQVILVTTRSHQKDKHGITCDRFRVILRLAEPMYLNEENYRIAMESIFNLFGSVADIQTKDPSRFFFASPDDSVIYYTNGTQLFDWREPYEQELRRRAIEDYRKRELARNQFDKGFGDVTMDNAAKAILRIDPDENYDKWIEVGMALKSEFGDSGFQIWDSWSMGGSKYSEREMDRKWKSFKGDGIKIGTLFHLSKR